jgi:hypothetical protein
VRTIAAIEAGATTTSARLAAIGEKLGATLAFVKKR